MGINVKVDETLLAEAARLAGEADQEKLLERLLRDFIQQRSPLQGMIDLVGKVRLRDDYDYKALRAGDSDPDRR